MDSPSPTSTPTLDKKWYPRFKALGAFQAHTFFSGDKNEQQRIKKEFLTNKLHNPSFVYSDIDLMDFKLKEGQLMKLKTLILESEPNKIVGLIYEWKIDEKLNEIELLRAAATQNMKEFKYYSAELYGVPSEAIFNDDLRLIYRQIESAQASGQKNLAKAADALLAMLPESEWSARHEEHIALPKKELFNQVTDYATRLAQYLLGDDFSILHEAIGSKTEYSAAQVAQLFERVFKRLKAAHWQAVVSDRMVFAMNQDRCVAQIPNKIYASQRVLELVVHELGVHLRRRLNGEQSPLQLLALGLNGYSDGEEGLAALIEDSLKPRFTDFFGLDRHLAIGLALGLDGTSRDFRGVFTVMQAYHLLKQLGSGKSEIEALALANESAWINAYRTFRGTDCVTKGVCFTKDLLYREGNIGMWAYLQVQSKKGPETVLEPLMLGKFNPLNPEHIWVLEELGILKNL